MHCAQTLFSGCIFYIERRHLFCQTLLRRLAFLLLRCLKCFTLCLRCIPVAYVLHGRFFCAVCKYDAIAAECIIRHTVQEISAVAEYVLTAVIFVINCLIGIVPDKASLVAREFIQQPDIALHTTDRISHIVHVFAEQIRLFAVRPKIFTHHIRCRVHTALHIADLVVLPVPRNALIVHDS